MLERLCRAAPIAGASWQRSRRGHHRARLGRGGGAGRPASRPSISSSRSSEPELLAAEIRHAGAIFLGRHTPEAVGDYVAGPNHVLPTARSARFSSGLGVLDFMKRTSMVRCDAREPRRHRPGGDDARPRPRGSTRTRCRSRCGSTRGAIPRLEAMPRPTQRIAKITLDERTVVRRNADIEHERAVAISDLLEETASSRLGHRAGRSISIWRSPRTAWRSTSATPTTSRSSSVVLSLAPFRSW